MKKYFATLDVGTSTIKGMLRDTTGRIHTINRQASPRLAWQGQRVEQDLNQYRDAILRCLLELSSVVPFSQCECLAITTQRNTMIGMYDLIPITPLISWLDRRTMHERLQDNKINGIRSLMSWLIEALTGNAFESASTATEAWLQQVETARLSGPTLVAPGRIAAAHPNNVLWASVIPTGLPIVIGAGDKDCALLGGEAYLPNRAVLCCGTAMSFGKLLSQQHTRINHTSIYYSPTNFCDYFPVETGMVNVSHHQPFKYQREGWAVAPSLSKLEGLLFTLMQCQLTLCEHPIAIDEIILGGYHPLLFKQLQNLADALNTKILVTENAELSSEGLTHIVLMTMLNRKSLEETKLPRHIDIIYEADASRVMYWQEKLAYYQQFL